MPTTTVPHMKLVPQRDDGVCWCASALMLYKWAKVSGGSFMIDPLTEPGTKYRWENNLDWADSDNGYLASTLQMKVRYDVPADYDGLSEFFHQYGPVWAAVQKNWRGHNYGHVVVLAGVNSNGVLVYDPEPVNRGSTLWLSWDGLQSAVDACGASIQFMTAR